jgi:hypothetical protein
LDCSCVPPHLACFWHRISQTLAFPGFEPQYFHLYLLHSWDYKSEPLTLGLKTTFFVVLEFKLRTSCLLGRHTWATLPALFCLGYFWDRVSWTICPDWLQTVILLISASWVARITNMSLQHWA